MIIALIVFAIILIVYLIGHFSRKNELDDDSQNVTYEKQTQVSNIEAKKGEKSFKAQRLDLSTAPYTPFPPSPNTWDMEKEETEQFRNSLQNKNIKAFYRAYWNKQYFKAAELAKKVPVEYRVNAVAKAIRTVYRKVIQSRRKSNHLSAAAKWSTALMDIVPSLVVNMDRNRHNKIVAELKKKGRASDYTPVQLYPEVKPELFSISDNTNWQLLNVEKLPKESRPDYGYKQVEILNDGCIFIDPKGRTAKAGHGKGSLLKKDRNGSTIAEKRLQYDIYRQGITTFNPYIIFMSSTGILHAYDEKLNQIYKNDLKTNRIVRKYFEANDKKISYIKSHVRSVGISQTGKRFLFSIADEAWLLDEKGNSIWGISLPLNEGWERIVKRVDVFGSKPKVVEALAIMGLELPFAPEAIKDRYHILAKQWHPDLNPGKPDAHEKMQQINYAFSILTGVDPNSFNIKTIEKETLNYTKSTTLVETDLYTISISVPTCYPKDWIYGITFAKHDHCVYLMSYSGKIIKVDSMGNPLSVYDFGRFINEVIDTGSYLYVLTATRLYIVNEHGSLENLIDIYKKGKLIVSENGFGLLDKKKLQWFTPEGKKIGEINTRDPIRVIYSDPSGLVVETRQNRTIVSGLQLH